jgi:hypothetical protein
VLHFSQIGREGNPAADIPSISYEKQTNAIPYQQSAIWLSDTNQYLKMVCLGN